MSIKDLYWILATYHIRLPYWFIALVLAIFIVLFFVLLVKWKKKKQEFCTKEEEIMQLNETISTSKRWIQEKDYIIKDLKRKNSTQEAFLNEKNDQYKIWESEKSDLLSKQQIQEKNIEKLNADLVLATKKIQKIEKEKNLLKNTQEDLNKKMSQFNVLEKKYSQTEFQNKTLENSKELLEKEINELKSTIKLQTNISKNEIKKLNLKIERRDKKIEKIKETLDEANKKLQMIQEKESPIEKTSQKINETLKETEQDKHIIKSKNLIERIARW